MDARARSDEARVGSYLAQNRTLCRLLERLEAGGFRRHYVGAGCIAQTVWNVQSGQPADAHIADYDIVYFDSELDDAESEKAVARALRSLTADLDVAIDVCNEARVHRWYEAEFGRPIPPYASIVDAIGSWPTTATCVGVRREGPLHWITPFGLQDLLLGVVRPNKRLVTREHYERKATRWRACWPHLHVVPW